MEKIYKTKILTEKQFKNLKHKVKKIKEVKTIERKYYYKAISNHVFNTKEHFVFYYKFDRKVPTIIKKKLKQLNLGNIIILDYQQEGEAIMSLKAFRYSNKKSQKNKELKKIYNQLELPFEERKYIRTSEKVFKDKGFTLKAPKPIIKEIIFSNGEGHFDLVSRPHLNFLRGLELSIGLGKTIPTGYLLSHINLIGAEKNPIREYPIKFMEKEEEEMKEPKLTIEMIPIKELSKNAIDTYCKNSEGVREFMDKAKQQEQEKFKQTMDKIKEEKMEKQIDFDKKAYMELNKLVFDAVIDYKCERSSYEAYKHDLIQKLRVILDDEVSKNFKKGISTRK